MYTDGRRSAAKRLPLTFSLVQKTGAGHRDARTFLLILRYAPEADGQVSALLQKLKCKLKNKSVSRGVTELTLEVKVKKGRIEFMDAFTAADFVDSATLVEYNGTYS